MYVYTRFKNIYMYNVVEGICFQEYCIWNVQCFIMVIMFMAQLVQNRTVNIIIKGQLMLTICQF